MKTRILLAALLSLSAAPALAGDRDPSPFYRSIFAVDINPAPRAAPEKAGAEKVPAAAETAKGSGAGTCACPEQPTASAQPQIH